MTKIAVLQMCSGIDPARNFSDIRNAAFSAACEGAKVLFTPEMSLQVDRDRARAAQHIEPENDSRYIRMIRDEAQRNDIAIALGSMAVALPDGKFANRSMLFRPESPEPIIYDKMHMFDVDLPTGEKWRESAAFTAGDEVVVVEDSPIGRLGLTVCYDLRFTELFRELVERRCTAISVPSAFTVPTGTAHWHVLLRARAIDSCAFVIAAAQVGTHEDGRQTFGHSLVVDPWGDVLLDLGGERPGIGYCNINLDRIAEVQAQVPALANRRDIPARGA